MKFVVTISLPTFFLNITEAQQGGWVDYLKWSELFKYIPFKVATEVFKKILYDCVNTYVDYFTLGLYAV